MLSRCHYEKSVLVFYIGELEVGCRCRFLYGLQTEVNTVVGGSDCIVAGACLDNGRVLERNLFIRQSDERVVLRQIRLFPESKTLGVNTVENHIGRLVDISHYRNDEFRLLLQGRYP